MSQSNQHEALGRKIIERRDAIHDRDAVHSQLRNYKKTLSQAIHAIENDAGWSIRDQDLVLQPGPPEGLPPFQEHGIADAVYPTPTLFPKPSGVAANYKSSSKALRPKSRKLRQPKTEIPFSGSCLPPTDIPYLHTLPKTLL